MKLFTIGDSISQAFMSMAAARTDLSYSTLLARKLGLEPDTNDYHYPDWPAGGLPINLERIMRTLTQRYGVDISGLEWLTVIQTINGVLDEAEDYYERGVGRADLPYQTPDGLTPNYFHNIAVTGFDVADAWLVTPEVCEQELGLHQRTVPSDGYLQGPSSAFYRTALKVLNPSLKRKYVKYSALDWLKTHAKEEGVENLVLWLGSNNALGTVINLKIQQTPNDPNRRPHTLSHFERAMRGWNLWHPADFEAEYSELLDRVDKIMENNTFDQWKVFIGTVPLVTIAPLAKGVGSTTYIPNYGFYYKYYTWFPFEEEFARETGKHLTMQDALHIDNCIRAYNAFIKQQIAARNAQHGRERYFVVDVAEALNQIAYKRNNSSPTYDFPDVFDYIHPMVNTKYYHADQQGTLKQGGIFGLDGVHPTVIGHGLVAFEFLKVMKDAGIVSDTDLPWAEIFAADRLYQEPIPLMHEIYGRDALAQHIVGLIQLFGSRE